MFWCKDGIDYQEQVGGYGCDTYSFFEDGKTALPVRHRACSTGLSEWSWLFKV